MTDRDSDSKDGLRDAIRGVFTNVYLFRRIVSFMNPIKGIRHRLETKTYDIQNFKSHRNYTLKVMKYKQIENAEWMCWHGYYSLLIDKVKRGEYIEFSARSTELICRDIREVDLLKVIVESDQYKQYFYSYRLIDAASASGNTPVVQYLLERGFGYSFYAFGLAAEGGYIDTLQYLLENAELSVIQMGSLFQRSLLSNNSYIIQYVFDTMLCNPSVQFASIVSHHTSNIIQLADPNLYKYIQDSIIQRQRENGVTNITILRNVENIKAYVGSLFWDLLSSSNSFKLEQQLLLVEYLVNVASTNGQVQSGNMPFELEKVRNQVEEDLKNILPSNKPSQETREKQNIIVLLEMINHLNVIINRNLVNRDLGALIKYKDYKFFKYLMRKFGLVVSDTDIGNSISTWGDVSMQREHHRYRREREINPFGLDVRCAGSLEMLVYLHQELGLQLNIMPTQAYNDIEMAKYFVKNYHGTMEDLKNYFASGIQLGLASCGVRDFIIDSHLAGHDILFYADAAYIKKHIEKLRYAYLMESVCFAIKRSDIEILEILSPLYQASIPDIILTTMKFGDRRKLQYLLDHRPQDVITEDVWELLGSICDISLFRLIFDKFVVRLDIANNSSNLEILKQSLHLVLVNATHAGKFEFIINVLDHHHQYFKQLNNSNPPYSIHINLIDSLSQGNPIILNQILLINNQYLNLLNNSNNNNQLIKIFKYDYVKVKPIKPVKLINRVFINGYYELLIELIETHQLPLTFITPDSIHKAAQDGNYMVLNYINEYIPSTIPNIDTIISHSRVKNNRNMVELLDDIYSNNKSKNKRKRKSN